MDGDRIGGSGKEFRIDNFGKWQSSCKSKVDIIQPNLIIGNIVSFKGSIASKCSTDEYINFLIGKILLTLDSIFILLKQAGDNIIKKQNQFVLI